MPKRVLRGAAKAKLGFMVIVISIVIAGAGLGTAIYLRGQNEAQFRDTHDAICALIADLEERTKSSRTFLVEHPKGIPGIPAATIREGIENQERSIDALSVASC